MVMSVGSITSQIMLAVKGKSDVGQVEAGLANLTQHIASLRSNLAKSQAQVNTLNKRLAGFENQTKKNTKTVRGFKIELLAMMFFWRQIGSATLGLLQPAAEAFGIFELWSQTLLIFFIPLMELISPLLYGIMDALMNLDPNLQLVIGGVILLVGAFAMAVVAAGIISASLKTLVGLGPLIVGFFGSVLEGLTAFVVSGAAAQVAAFGLAMGIIFLGGYLVWLTDKLGGVGELVKAVARGYLILQAIQEDVFAGRNPFTNYSSSLQQLYDKIDAPGSFFRLKDGIEGQSLGPVAFIKDMASQFKSAFSSITADSAVTSKEIQQQYTDLGSNMVVVTESIKTQSQLMIGELGNMAVASVEIVGKAASEMDKKIASVTSKYSSGPLFDGKSGSTGDGSSGNPYTSSSPSTKSKVTQKTSKKVNDFVWRPGEGAVSISPDDNLIGFKGNTPPGMGGGGVVINQVINVGIAGRDEIARMIEQNNKKLTADIQRLI